MAQGISTLNDSVIVITGCSSGFGRGAAIKLAEKGAHVILTARRTALIEALADEIVSQGGNATAITLDVSDMEAVKSLADTVIQKFGRMDIWVNNVGVGAIGKFWDIPLEDHARVVDVNLKGLIYGAHVALTQFVKQGYGHLINIGSIDSEVPLALQNTYASTKAAVLSLSRSLNEELHLSGLDETVKVGTIMPWAVDTPWWTHAANYTGHAPRMAAMDDPEIVVDAIVEACLHPQEEQPVGAIAKASNISHHLFPDMTERFSAKLADKEARKAMPMAPTTGSIYTPMKEGTTMDGGIRERMKKEDAA